MSNIKSTQYPNIEIEYILTVRGKEEMRGTKKECNLKFYGLDRNTKAFATITPVLPVEITLKTPLIYGI